MGTHDIEFRIGAGLVSLNGDSGFVGDDIERVAARDESAAADRITDCGRAMEQLKPRERAMLWLAYAEGASHREIADVLGLSPSSLKPMLFRARRRLAALLGRAPDGGNDETG